MNPVCHQKRGRSLVWNDEFEAQEIDTDKWNFLRTMGGADRLFDNSRQHARTEKGVLLLQAHKTDDPDHPWSLSEGLTTSQTMLFTYGYLEIKARPSFRHGAWPSFWMQSATPFRSVPWFSEVDIFEVFSSSDTLVANLHKWGEKAHVSLDGIVDINKRSYTHSSPEQLKDEFHIYGLEWDKKAMSFYVDDTKFAEFPISEADCPIPNKALPGTACFHDPHFLIFNNELFTPKGDYCPPQWRVNETDPFPVEYSIDYVRLYQKEGELLLLKDEIAKQKS